MSRVVYGVVRAPHPAIDAAGIGRAAVEQVTSDDVVAIVGDAPPEMLARRRDVTAHMDVLDEAMRHGPVLPFRFGTVADDDDAVRQLLAERGAELRHQLDELDGAVQVTLRITEDEDAAVRAAVDADRGLRRLVASGRNRRGSLGDQVLLGERIAAAVSARAGAVRSDALSRLQPHVVALVPTDDAAAVLSVAMLVPSAELPAVDEVVESLGRELGAGASVDYAGPMPAYSFVR